MEQIIREVALEIFPNTTYDDALCILEKKLRQLPRKTTTTHKMMCQSMLVYNDPMVHRVLELKHSSIFRDYLTQYNNMWKTESKPFSLRLSGSRYVFPSKRSGMIFCYHPSVVSKWYRLRGAPKNIRIPSYTFIFGSPSPQPFDKEEWEALMERNRLPPGVKWGDLMMETDEEDSS
jgi:hypothetical protein